MSGRLPDLVIAGVTKAGTTSLFSYLTAHPSVCGSAVKSTQHFLPLRYGQPIGSLDDYRAFFTDCATAPVVMEATPGYFYGGHAVADELRRAVPDVKVLIALREPVSRLVSYYRFQQSMVSIPLDLSLADYVAQCEAIDPERFGDPALADPELNPWIGVEGGRYDRYLPAWLQFGANARVIFFEDLVRDPAATLAELAPWLGIDPAPFATAAFRSENRTVVPRSSGVQRLALGARRRLDGVLRGHPELTRTLRTAYQRVNGSPPAPPPGDPALDLGDRYVESNAATAALLRHAGVTRLPSWLA